MFDGKTVKGVRSKAVSLVKGVRSKVFLLKGSVVRTVKGVRSKAVSFQDMVKVIEDMLKLCTTF